jgi:hypothetical protein
MNVSKKVTDFIVLDEGNIGRKAVTVTGATLAASVLGVVLQTSVAHACLCAHIDDHTNTHQDGYDDCVGCW